MPFKTKHQTPLEEAIESAFVELSEHGAVTEEYAQIVNQLEKLHDMKKQETANRVVSPDTLIAAAGNLLGIVVILGYERTHVIATKALGFVLKSRL